MYNGLPFVSVIIPTYNRRAFIEFALESLFRQTYPKERMEIIVIDDGSTDNTHEILKEYAGKIIYIYQKNKGVASARNKGISMAKGEIITFLDADDEWHETRIVKIVNKFIERPNIGAVYHPIEVIDVDGVTIYKDFYKSFGYKAGISGWIINEILSGKIYCGGSSFAFRKEVIEKSYPIPEDIKRGVDYYIVSISANYAPVEYIPEILGKYRVHKDNITLLAGQNNYKELALINKDFAYLRQVIIDKLQAIDSLRNKFAYIGILKRIWAKEEIFYEILSGRRGKAIKKIPLLFSGKPTYNEILRGGLVSLMALCIPSPLFPFIVKIYGFFKRFKII